MSDDTVRVLTRARELVDTEDKWSPKGPGTAIRSGDDGSRCALFAIQHAAARLGTKWEEALNIFRDQAWAGRSERLFVATWNDEKGRTHAEVLACFDKSIRFAETME